MDVREKLMELQGESDICPEGVTSCFDCQYYIPTTFGKPCDVRKAIADKMIANGVTVQEWISVKDRLPEESGMYIVTANDGHAQRVSFVLWQKKNRMWNLTGARSYWRITHWQPMPQPPKGE